MSGPSSIGHISSWGFGLLLVVIGLLNIILVHPVPGLIYLVLACIYMPPTAVWLKKKISFSIPRAVKIILGLLIMWVTLGVGDLMEIFEASVLR